MSKKIEQWACDKCGRTFGNKQAASECEGFHFEDFTGAEIKIENNPSLRYPMRFTVVFPDGAKVVYSFVEVCFPSDLRYKKL